MSILTKALAATVGIQYQGVKDQSATNAPDGLSTAIFCGRYKRGRLDKPFAVTDDNIAARLGYDPMNPDYMAVRDCLDLGVPQVYVQRVRAGFVDPGEGPGPGDWDNYNLPETTIGMDDEGNITLTDTGAELTIVFSMFDVMDDGCNLEVSFYQRAGASTVTGLADVVGQLVWKDADTGQELYRLSGLMAERAGGVTLAQAAEDSELFDSFVVTLAGVDADVAANCLASDAGNLPNTLGRKKVVLALTAVPGVSETVPAAFYTRTANTLITGEVRPDYLALAQTSDLALITTLMRVMDKLNIHLAGDVDPSVSVDSATSAVISISAQDHRVSWYWNPTESRPRDAVSSRGARITRPVVGVQIGYRLLRNAGTDSLGVPPIHVPVAGYNFPIPFKAIRSRADIVLDEAALIRLAEAKINVVVLERLNAGARFIFGDCLTQYDSQTSALRLTNSAEIETFTANGVIELIRRQLLTNTDSFIERADTDCRQFLDACVTAGLLKPAKDLGGKPYELSISAREDRPFDAVDVDFKRRPEGAVRAAYLTTTINK